MKANTMYQESGIAAQQSMEETKHPPDENQGGINDEQLIASNWTTRAFIFGTAFFIIGLIINDVYTVVAGLSLIIIGTISATGEKIIQTLSTKPKGL